MPFLKYAQYFPLGHPWISPRRLSFLQLRLSQSSQQLVAHCDLLIFPENKDDKKIQGVFSLGLPLKVLRTRIPPQPPVSNRKISNVPSYRFDNLVCIHVLLLKKSGDYDDYDDDVTPSSNTRS